MRKKNHVKEERFEFVFYINNNIIVQRFFYVPKYNHQFTKSYEAKELMDEIIGMNGELGRLGLIPASFQANNMRELWDSYNPYYTQTEDRIKSWDLFSKEDHFSLKIKVDKRTVAEGYFCGNFFPTSIRHSVDINPIIPEIIETMKHYMSLDEYTLVEKSGVEV
jgi:hypothetical protein